MKRTGCEKEKCGTTVIFGACLTTEPAFTSQDAFVQFRVGTLWANADYATVNACLTGIPLISVNPIEKLLLPSTQLLPFHLPSHIISLDAIK